MEGHQRAIIGTMDVTEIFRDRKKFAAGVVSVATDDLLNMGLRIVSYTIKDVSDSVGYLKNLGVPRIQDVKKVADVGEAVAQMHAAVKLAETQQAYKAVEFSNKVMISESERDRDLKKAAYAIETLTKKAEADLAYSLQEAVVKQKLKEEELKIKVVEKKKEIQVQEQEIVRKERELDATVRKPASAQAYKVKLDAEGQMNKTIYDAEARASAIKQTGDANAFAIAAKATAEAKAMQQKADAMQLYKEAAMISMVCASLPQITREIAGPLSKANKITMIAGEGGDVGAERLTNEVLNLVSTIPKAVQEMTGFDLLASIDRASRS